VPAPFGRLVGLDHFLVRVTGYARPVQQSGHRGSRLELP
jgi:hypothetical protein